MMGECEMSAIKVRNNLFSRLFLVLLGFTVLAITPLHGYAQDDEDDDELSFTFEEKLESCGACHGEDGATPMLPEYPILAGQYPDYITQALRQYRDGQRTNVFMVQQVQILELTDDDMVRLGKHFGAKSGVYNLTK